MGKRVNSKIESNGTLKGLDKFFLIERNSINISSLLILVICEISEILVFMQIILNDYD